MASGRGLTADPYRKPCSPTGGLRGSDAPGWPQPREGPLTRPTSTILPRRAWLAPSIPRNRPRSD